MDFHGPAGDRQAEAEAARTTPVAPKEGLEE
jgi:hypothetical protein